MRQPNEDLRQVAQGYNERRHGLGRIVEGHWAEVDEGFSRRTAKAYEAMPATAGFMTATERAYAQFRVEVWRQYHWLVARGYVMVETREDPYPDSAAMHEAARTKVLKVFESVGAAHYYLNAATNTVFRWVHDLFGHAAEGYGFGPRGEFNAALHHAQMFSPLARLAMLTETHGQNSWFNYGPTPGQYAEQKAALLPSDITREFDRRVDALVKE